MRLVDLARGGRRASGAVTAQLAQALTSFLLHVAASRQLGPSGLGVFALLYSGVVLATALSTGLVGDSLTVLRRERPTTRAGLQVVGVGVAVCAGTIAGPLALLTGLISGREAALFGIAVAVFVIEDLIRRLLMACLRFWSLVATDATVMVVTVGWLIGMVARSGSLSISDLLVALVVGQVVGLVLGVVLLPGDERNLAPVRGAAVTEVLRFGGWRAAQQGVRPATMAITRIVVVAGVGAAVFGQLEAARIYVAPALLLVNGVAGFLFASYAAERTATRRALLRRADRTALAMFAMIVVMGLTAVVLLPFAARIVTAGVYELDPLAVIGWALYAACSAMVSPYGGLAAVSGRHVQVFAFRLIEAIVAITIVVVLVVAVGAPVSWVPFALAVGALASGLTIRQRALLRGVDLDAPSSIT